MIRRTNEEILKQNKYNKKAMDVLMVIFLLAIGGAVVFHNILVGVLGIALWQLLISLNNSRRFNEVIMEVRLFSIAKSGGKKNVR